MKICLITDAWYPQVNGVVRTLDTVRGILEAEGHDFLVISPDRFRSFPCPTYPEIRLAVGVKGPMRRMIDDFMPDAIHIATEGPLGYAAMRYATRRGIPFTTAYHTKFPEYINVRTGIPEAWLYRALRWFHNKGAGVMVATKTLAQELETHGVERTRAWSRGVDLELFYPRDKAFFDFPRPVQLYVGRVAVEKNIKKFCESPAPGTKVVVGDGPQRAELEKKHADVRFVGIKKGEELARHYAAADVFVFPSLTDTFGLVMLEALASGVPVAAYPVPGPLDVIGRDGRGTVDGFDRPIGWLDEDLAAATEKALAARPEDCREYALNFSWEACAVRFLANLEPGDYFPEPARDEVAVSAAE